MLKVLLLVFFHSFGDATYIRNPQTVVAHKYEITTELGNDSFESNKFKGQTIIVIEPLQNLKNVLINCINITIESVQLEVSAGSPKEKLTFIETKYDLSQELADLVFEQTLQQGTRYNLSISYTGLLNDKFPRGFYKSWYVDGNGTKHYLAVTHFELSWAPRAFPCFDEPAMKAEFIHHLICPSKYKSWSNQIRADTKNLSNSLVKTTFKVTPLMSTFVVAFVIAEFTCTSLKSNKYIKVCSRPETRADRQYALQISSKLMAFMENFTNTTYSSFGIEKFQMIAIPNFLIDYDFRGRSMGNWGLTTYSEEVLLYNERFSSSFNKERIAINIAYQVASMWFGCLTTGMTWKYNTLNAGLAAYLGYLALNEVEKNWKFDHQFIIKHVHSVLRLDTSGTVPPLSLEADSIDDFRRNSAWSTSYIKGANVIRMMIHYIASERHSTESEHLANKVRSIIRHRQGSTTTWINLDDDLDESIPSFVGLFFENWENVSNYPLITVNIVDNDVVMEQEDMSMTNQSHVWTIPITYTTSDERNFSAPRLLIYKKYHEQMKLLHRIKDKDEWVILNSQQIGYFRVLYEGKLWQHIYNVLKTSPKIIHPLNKAQIVDDLFNLAVFEKITYKRLWESLDFLKSDDDYFPWKAALTNFEIILSKIYDQHIYNKLLKYIENLLSDILPRYQNRSTTSYIDKLENLEIFKWSCLFKQHSCIEFSMEAFHSYRDGFQFFDPDLIPIIFCTVLSNGDHIEEYYQFLWNKYQKTLRPSEQNVILEALTCTGSTKMLKTFLTSIITESEIQKQHMLLLIDLTALHLGSIDTVRRFITKNFQKIVDNCYEDVVYVYLPRVLSKFFRRKLHVVHFKNALSKQQLSERAKGVLTLTLSIVKKGLGDIESLENGIEGYINNHSASNISHQKILILITYCCFILIIK